MELNTECILIQPSQLPQASPLLVMVYCKDVDKNVLMGKGKGGEVRGGEVRGERGCCKCSQINNWYDPKTVRYRSKVFPPAPFCCPFPTPIKLCCQ